MVRQPCEASCKARNYLEEMCYMEGELNCTSTIDWNQGAHHLHRRICLPRHHPRRYRSAPLHRIQKPFQTHQHVPQIPGSTIIVGSLYIHVKFLYSYFPLVSFLTTHFAKSQINLHFQCSDV